MMKQLMIVPLVIASFCWAQTDDLAKAKVDQAPPKAALENIVTDYFGTKVSDPYRWMETSAADPRLKEYLTQQNDYARAQLAAIPARSKLLARIQELDNAAPLVNNVQRAGKKVFFLQLPSGEETFQLMVKEADGTTRKLLDPSQFHRDRVHAAIDYFVPSPDGRYVVVGISWSGSEDSTIRILDTTAGSLIADSITRTQYSDPKWHEDSRSFYYARLQKLAPGTPASGIFENQKVYLHALGTDPETDVAVFGPGVSETADVTNAGFSSVYLIRGAPYLLAVHYAGTVDPASFYLAKLDKADDVLRWKQIISSQDQVAPLIPSVATHGSMLYLVVTKNAPNRKLVQLDLSNPDMSTARELLPNEKDWILTGVYAAQDALYVSNKSGVKFQIRRMEYNQPGKWQAVPLPYPGTVPGYSVETSPFVKGVTFTITAWTKPRRSFQYDPARNKSVDLELAPKDTADFSGVEAREVFARSADGTMVPLSILCKKGIKLVGSHPSLLVGYGAYGLSIVPAYDATALAWLERGGVLSFVHARGGGEYGERWHNAGRKETKQHTIDDMIAAARYLIDNGYSSAAHLAVMGTSAGGIAMGGAVVQHPELFAVAIDNVGVTDMVRFQGSQGGSANIPEFGDVTKEEQFKYLYAVSPYHHVADSTRYPAALGITGANDPRVPSWQVAKMIARLQQATSSYKPVLLRVDFEAGHVLGNTRSQDLEQQADVWSFILWQTGDLEFRMANPHK